MATCQADTTKVYDHQRERNILLIGQTGSGKSTLANAILKSDSFKVGEFDRTTILPIEPRSTEVFCEFSNVTYKVTLLDTRGLGENSSRRKLVGTRKAEYRSDANILDEIRKHMQSRKITNLHLILFVVKYSEAELSGRQKAVFKFMLNSFQEHAKQISRLVLTHCDLFNSASISRDDIIEKYRTRKDTAFITEFMGNGIITVGFPKNHLASDSKTSNFSESLKRSIQDDKEVLFQTIYDATNPIHHLDVMKSHYAGCSFM